MTKKWKIVTIVSAVIVALAIIAGTLVYCLYKPPISQQDKEVFYSKWQDYLKDDVKIVDAVIPGSHDAGTKGMMNLAETQNATIGQQLEAGARYFDVRVAQKDDGSLVIFHGIINGGSFVSVLDEIKAFVDKNPTQIIVLDFQHFSGGSEFAVAKLLDEKLQAPTTAVPNTVAIKDLTFKEIRAKHYNYIITWGSSDFDEQNKSIFLRETALRSPYTAKFHQKSNQFLIDSFATYYEYSKGDTLFVLQSQLTPIGTTPFNAEKNFCDEGNNFVKGLSSDKKNLDRTNIVMRDFITMKKETIDLILSLNIDKNNIIKSKMDNFKEAMA